MVSRVEKVFRQMRAVLKDERKQEAQRAKEQKLRADYCKLFEEELDLMGVSHWGKKLRCKMQCYTETAITVMDEWKVRNGIDENLAEKVFYVMPSDLWNALKDKHQEAFNDKGLYGDLLMFILFKSYQED